MWSVWQTPWSTVRTTPMGVHSDRHEEETKLRRTCYSHPPPTLHPPPTSCVLPAGWERRPGILEHPGDRKDYHSGRQHTSYCLILPTNYPVKSNFHFQLCISEIVTKCFWKRLRDIPCFRGTYQFIGWDIVYANAHGFPCNRPEYP